MKFLDVPQSGSIAGTTHSHNRAGQYKRNRRAPVNSPGTGRRAAQRTAFGAASSAYAALTNAQRLAWDSFAAGHPVTDALGSSVTLTGHQMFVGVGSQNINIGNALPTVPPSSSSVMSLGVVTAVATVSGGIVITQSLGDPDQWILVAVSRPLSPARTFMKTFWQALVVDGTVAPITVTKASYEGQFGTLIAGQKIMIKLTPVNGDGFTGTPLIFPVVVA